jgi:outer membrane protein assembly factor BamA
MLLFRLNAVRLLNKHYLFTTGFNKIRLTIFLVCVVAMQTVSAQTDSVKVDSTRKKSRYFPSPVVGYTPETRLYFGAGLVWYLPPSKKYPATFPSVLKSVFVYTLNKQVESNISGDSYLKNNLYKLNYSTSYFKFPDSFFGIGNNTLESDREKYDYDYFNFYVNGQRLMKESIYVGAKTFFEYTKVYNVAPGGFFDTDTVPGEEGGINTGIGPWITYDTRDNIYFPIEGISIDVSAVAHHKIFGSAYNYIDYLVEASQFNKIGKDDVIAFNLYGQFVPGNPPFNRMAELGGDKHMRGNFEGRFRDKNYLTLQAEYRITFWKYFGINIFAGIGEVAETFSDFNTTGLKYSYGAGGRLFIVPEDKLSLRVDYGFDGQGNGGLYVTFREAF